MLATYLVRPTCTLLAVLVQAMQSEDADESFIILRRPAGIESSSASGYAQATVNGLFQQVAEYVQSINQLPEQARPIRQRSIREANQIQMRQRTTIRQTKVV